MEDRWKLIRSAGKEENCVEKVRSDVSPRRRMKLTLSESVRIRSGRHERGCFQYTSTA